MTNPMLSKLQNNQPGNIVQQYMQFRNQYAGKDAKQIVQEMLNNGQMTQEQFNQLSQQVNRFRNQWHI